MLGGFSIEVSDYSTSLIAINEVMIRYRALLHHFWCFFKNLSSLFSQSFTTDSFILLFLWAKMVIPFNLFNALQYLLIRYIIGSIFITIFLRDFNPSLQESALLTWWEIWWMKMSILRPINTETKLGSWCEIDRYSRAIILLILYFHYYRRPA